MKTKKWMRDLETLKENIAKCTGEKFLGEKREREEESRRVETSTRRSRRKEGKERQG